MPPGASRFTTALQLTATEQPEEQPAPPASANPDHAGCASPGAAPDGAPAATPCSLALVYSVRCGASSVPWPMSATIENIMAEKALVGGGRDGTAAEGLRQDMGPDGGGWRLEQACAVGGKGRVRTAACHGGEGAGGSGRLRARL